MASIGFGGDPESFMEAPRMENKGLAESLGFSPIAAFLDLIGVHRQVAKEPKVDKDAAGPATSNDIAKSPSVLQDVESALAEPTGHKVAVNSPGIGTGNNMLASVQSAVTPSIHGNKSSIDPKSMGPMTPWGQRWLDSNKPLLSIDPDSIF